MSRIEDVKKFLSFVNKKLVVYFLNCVDEEIFNNEESFDEIINLVGQENICKFVKRIHKCKFLECSPHLFEKKKIHQTFKIFLSKQRIHNKHR